MLRRAYERLFLERIEAIVNRLDTLLGELDALRAAVAEVGARQDAFDAHVQAVIADRWECAALERRMSALEARLQPGPDAAQRE